MSTRAERCRARAKECMVKALAALDPDVRRQFTDLATQWHQLAEQLEKEENSNGRGQF
jgi:hypothetical protein